MAGAVPRHAQPSLPRATMGKPDGSALNPTSGHGVAGGADPPVRGRRPRPGRGRRDHPGGAAGARPRRQTEPASQRATVRRDTRRISPPTNGSPSRPLPRYPPPPSPPPPGARGKRPRPPGPARAGVAPPRGDRDRPTPEGGPARAPTLGVRCVPKQDGHGRAQDLCPRSYS